MSELHSLQVGRLDSHIVICSDRLSEVGPYLQRLSSGSRAVVMTAAPIYRRFGRVVVQSFRQSGFAPLVITLPVGERVKSLRWASVLYDRLLNAKCGRDSIVVALGGGVIGDLAGFVASTYLRGVCFAQIPTTVVAQVDASIGGKTGVNHARGKNLIGTFCQPKLIFIDVATLRTLPKRELIGGMAEVVKYGVIADAELFGYLEEHVPQVLALQLGVLERIVLRSAAIKADVVGKDEREAGLRRILNYGHTLGHAIETATGYRRYHHGEAIAIGMAFAARLAVRLGFCDNELVHRQDRLLKQLGLPTRLPPRTDRRKLMAIMELDKKVKGGRLHFVLPERLGSVTVVPVDRDLIMEALRAFSVDTLR